MEGVQLEIQELTDLVSELVELAGDSSGSGEALEAVELADLARDVAARARRRSGREIEVTATGTTTVFVRPQMVERAIGNLVDNTLKYSPDGTSVDVVIDGTQLEVRDLGSGFSDVDLPHVFDRFYRSVEARDAVRLRARSRDRAPGGRAPRRHGMGGEPRRRGAAVGFELPAASGSATAPSS